MLKLPAAEATRDLPHQTLIYLLTGAPLQAEFVDSDQLGASERQEPQQYNAITCMFAIHYFFVSPAALHRFMENVSINLEEGEHI